MNIWILNHYATPPDTAGSTRHYDFARELINQGHKVKIFASGFDHRTRKDERLSGNQGYRIETIGGVEFTWLRTTPYYGGNDWRRVVNMISYAMRVLPLGLKIKEKPAVIISSSPHPFTGLAGWLLGKLKRAEFIFEVRDLWPQTLVEIGGYDNNSPVVLLLRLLERFLYQKASEIVVLLPRASDYITRLGIPADRIVHIPNGVNCDDLTDIGAKLPGEIDRAISKIKAGGKLIVGYTGAHGIANSLDTVVKAARLLQDRGDEKVHFLLVGEGPEKVKLVSSANSRGLKNISFFPPVPKSSLPALLKYMDVTLILSLMSKLYQYGVSPNKVFDYMAVSKPIIWGISTIDDPVVEANCVITVPPEDPGALAAAVLQLYAIGNEERRRIGMRGYEYVVKYHSTRILADQLLAVIHDTVSRSGMAG